MKIFIFNLLWLKREYKYFKFMEMQEKVVRDIFSKKSDILKEIFDVIIVIKYDLKKVLLIFYIVIGYLSFIDYNEGKQNKKQFLDFFFKNIYFS